MQVHVAKADLTLMPVDAIVNPANSLGIMGGGASGAIKRRGGDKIQQEAMASAPIAGGAAGVLGPDLEAGLLRGGSVDHCAGVQLTGGGHDRAVIHAPTME